MTRTEAARTNGALSHGPVTPAGKAVSSRNAIKHGLNAAEIVIRGEDPLAFAMLLENMQLDLGAVTAYELDLVHEMAVARWRLRRLTIMEKAVIETEFHRRQALIDSEEWNSPEQLSAEAWMAVADGSAMKQIHRHETRLRRAFEKAASELSAVIEFRHQVITEQGQTHCCIPGGPVEQRLLDEEAQLACDTPPDPVQNEPEPVLHEPADEAPHAPDDDVEDPTSVAQNEPGHSTAAPHTDPVFGRQHAPPATRAA